MNIIHKLASIKKTLQDLGGTSVQIVAVSKNATIKQIEEAFSCGITEFGENRIQEALAKQGELPAHLTPYIHWHFIGHLQSNKVKKAIGKFVLIHSVDSLHLAQEISKEAVKQNFTQPILLQVKIVPDNTKFGFSPHELKEQFLELKQLPGININGLMTMAPLTNPSSIWRTCFSGLKNLKDELEKIHNISLHELSMGMTDDWQEAVKCGATMLRLGRAIFEK